MYTPVEKTILYPYCSHCEALNTRPRSKYCTLNCATQAWYKVNKKVPRGPELNCIICGGGTGTDRAKCCSNHCYMTERRRQRKLAIEIQEIKETTINGEPIVRLSKTERILGVINNSLGEGSFSERLALSRIALDLIR